MALESETSAWPSGWLTKKGGFRTSWRRRWFALDESGDNLQYFEDPDASSSASSSPPSECETLVLRGSIAVADMVRIAPALFKDEDQRHSLSLDTFQIETIHRCYLMRADTASEQAAWVAGLRKRATEVRSACKRELDALQKLSVVVCGSLRKAETESDEFTAYRIQITVRSGESSRCGAGAWEVFKRYSEFRALAMALEACGEIAPLPVLPPTKWFYNDDPAVIRERRAGLQNWLCSVMECFANPLEHLGHKQSAVWPKPPRRSAGDEDSLSNDAVRVTWSMVAEDDPGDRVYPIPHVSLGFIHAFLETSTSALGSNVYSSTDVSESPTCASDTDLGPVVAGAIAAARAYSDGSDVNSADISHRQQVGETSPATKIDVDTDGDPVYSNLRSRHQAVHGDSWRVGSWIGPHHDFSRRRRSSTTCLTRFSMQCCCVTWFLVLAVLVFAGPVLCGQGDHNMNTWAAQTTVIQGAARSTSEDASTSQSMGNVTNVSEHGQSHTESSLEAAGDDFAVDTSQFFDWLQTPACALFPAQLPQLESMLPKLSVIGVILALLHIVYRADRALAARGNGFLGGCLCRGHQVRLPAKRRPWTEHDRGGIFRSRWSIFSNNYSTTTSGSPGERQPLLPRPVDITVSSTPPIAYEAF